MDYKLELVPIPVTDVDRAKAFYSEKAGFNVDLDTGLRDGFRVVQLTPPGSACSISIGVGIVDTPPGSVRGLLLVVSDIEAARAKLLERGLKIGPIQRFENGAWIDGKGGDWNSFARFSDPDGNTWALQEAPANR
jgi:catechol 2,3-dioxygenase-like lactoylglutathione lyase family enzyme